MAKSTQAVLEKRMSNIKRGAYWFGIIGRLSMFIGFLILIFTVGALFLQGMARVNAGTVSFTDGNSAIAGLGQGLGSLLYGWLFLLGRDAFQAIEALIQEMQEIV